MKRKSVVILIVVLILILLIATNLFTDLISLQLGRNEETVTPNVTETITVVPSTGAILSSETTDTTDRIATISSARSSPSSSSSSSSSEAMSAESTDLTETTTTSTPRDTPASKITRTVPPTVPITVTTVITSPTTVEIIETTTTATTDVTTGTASEITATGKSSTVLSTLTTTPTSPPTMPLSSVTQIGTHTSDTTGPDEDCNTICIIRVREIDITTTAITTSIKKDTTMYYTKALASEFDYAVRDIETGTACVLTNMRIRINLQYVTNVSQTNEATLTVPAKAKPTGICGDEIIKMTLRWKEPVGNEDENDEKENGITFRYIRNGTSFFLDYISIDVHLDGNNFPRALQRRMNGETADRHLQLFSASVKDEMFVCRTDTAVNVGDQMDVVISDIRLIAFNECIQNCSVTDDDVVTTKTTIDVGMIIGATIIGIILMLSLTFLILYFKWRARSERLARSQDPTNSAYRQK